MNNSIESCWTPHADWKIFKEHVEETPFNQNLLESFFEDMMAGDSIKLRVAAPVEGVKVYTRIQRSRRNPSDFNVKTWAKFGKKISIDDLVVVTKKDKEKVCSKIVRRVEEHVADLKEIL
jgi:hypothetical protein